MVDKIIDSKKHTTEVGEVRARGSLPVIVDCIFPKGKKQARLIQLAYAKITKSHPILQGSRFKTSTLEKSIKAMGNRFISRDILYYKVEKELTAVGHALASVSIF